ncbi:efflux RND transporter permease subunit [Albibacterium indicum]|uniref:efflux RND transporter permease subunit n=1 Tax=Albibacterium indicum TaxID=2292082 RepID=UPI000E5208CC|nr:efflux RND transporter permease subunit [Pedobacter indicus]
MVRHLINRPIAVFMAVTAFFIIGMITYMNVPVSLLPNIPIPEITVQVSGNNISARELENSVVSPIRRQLLQVGKLQDLRTETRDGNSVIKLNFKYGADIDLAFIEVNEKIDVAMNYIPRSIDRPRVVKASATDIPVFKLNLTLKEDLPYGEHNMASFLELSELSESVIRRRIEQLPEISMVDMTGLVKKQVSIIPDKQTLAISGITYADLENSLLNNNIEPGSMKIKDGHYEYNINFSSLLRTVSDVANIYIKKNEKIYQFKDIAQIKEVPIQEKGISFYNGKRAIVLDIIKQADENMATMQEGLSDVVDQLRLNYPQIAFDISQNQTELLDYTISNLQQNLILAFIFVCLVSIFFLSDIRAPLIIGISVFVSLIIAFLFFYLFNISLNVVSLTGLILALGMMIDNSIIVTDNIGQYQKKGLTLDDAVVMGTNEVIAPMLSSALTTISVFMPLIFLSGIAGAIFFDQAFSVAVGLMVSYLTGIMFVPVLYKTVYSIKPKGTINFAKRFGSKDSRTEPNNEKEPLHHRIYHQGTDWIFRHKLLTATVMVALLPFCFLLLQLIPKEKMPDISQNELVVTVEWNENINLEANENRIRHFLQNLDSGVIESAALVGEQQFLLNKDREKTSTESEIYLKVPSDEDIPVITKKVQDYFSGNHPDAAISFAPSNTIFESIFATNEPDLTMELYKKNIHRSITAGEIEKMGNDLSHITAQVPSIESFENQINIHIDRAKLLLYNVSFNTLLQTLETSLSESEITTLRSYQQYLPIVVASNQETDLHDILESSLVQTEADENGRTESLPLNSFVSTTTSEDLKSIIAGRTGEYIPYHFFETNHAEQLIDKIEANQASFSDWDISFSGSYFTNNEMLTEMMIILAISIMLMYFILAAQFESFVQPLIVLLEIPIAIAAALALLLILGHSLNLMSAIGIIVTCGIIINDSILKVDMMNQLRRSGVPLIESIHEAGKRRLNAILMTSLTSIVCMAPLLFSSDMGSELEKPLAIATIGGMVIGTIISVFVVPLAYWAIYRKQEKN